MGIVQLFLHRPSKKLRTRHAQAHAQKRKKKEVLLVSLIHKGCAPDYCLRNATLPGQVNHHPSGMTMAPPRAWHDNELRVVEGHSNAGERCEIGVCCCVVALLALPSQPGSGLLPVARRACKHGQGKVREANSYNGDGKPTGQPGSLA